MAVGKGCWVLEVVLSCVFCEKTMLELQVYESTASPAATFVALRESSSGLAPDEVIVAWPRRAPRELDASAPEALRSLYTEASTAEYAGALRGAAALYRAAVEELCSDQNASGKDLKARINALATKGVERAIISDLHEARLLENWSLHEGLTFSAEEVRDVAELVEEAVQVLYVQPATRQAMRDARKARRDSAGQP